MAQGWAADDEKNGERARHRSPRVDPRHDYDPNHDDSHRWPTEAPSVAVARVVLKVDGSITLKRATATATAWLTAHHHAAPALPIKPTRMELAVIIALVDTFGASLYKDARFVSVLDFIADVGAVALVQRVMYGARIEHDDSASGIAHENTRLADVLRDARVAFEFLCATWPDVFLAETHALLADVGVHVRTPDADRMPPMGEADSAAADTDAAPGGDDDGDADEPDGGGEGGHG